MKTISWPNTVNTNFASLRRRDGQGRFRDSEGVVRNNRSGNALFEAQMRPQSFYSFSSPGTREGRTAVHPRSKPSTSCWFSLFRGVQYRTHFRKLPVFFQAVIRFIHRFLPVLPSPSYLTSIHYRCLHVSTPRQAFAIKGVTFGTPERCRETNRRVLAPFTLSRNCS